MLRKLTREHTVDADDMRAVIAAGVSREQIEDALANNSAGCLMTTETQANRTDADHWLRGPSSGRSEFSRRNSIALSHARTTCSASRSPRRYSSRASGIMSMTAAWMEASAVGRASSPKSRLTGS
jgi:hypothetical protein